MKTNYYKVFFTISFSYKLDSKKTVTKSFKSDLDINSNNFNTLLNDKNVYEEWQKYALAKPLNNLNPPSEFIEKNASEKKLLTHRIVNLESLTEVF